MRYRTIDRIGFVLLSLTALNANGCLLAAAGAGAEVGYVATQDDRTASETVQDQVITSSIKTKLIADSVAPGMDINVDTFRGHVTLRGALRSQDQVDRALRIARETEDVKDVESKLVIVN